MSSHEKQDKTPVSQETPETSEYRMEIVQGDTFKPLVDKPTGTVKGFISSAPDRKPIVIGAEVEPEKQFAYKIEITEDTKEDDPSSGKLIGHIVRRALAVPESDWEHIDNEVDSAEINARKLRILDREIYQHTKVPASERYEVGSSYEPGDDGFQKELEEMRAGLSEDVDALLGPDNSPHRTLVDFKEKLLFRSMREYLKLTHQDDILEGQEIEQLKQIQKLRAQGKSVQRLRLEVRATREQRRQLSEAIKELAESSPEAYYGIHLHDLKGYKQNLQEGRLVETPYVRKNAHEMANQLKLGTPVFVYGHLGAGKTELAMYVASNMILADRDDLNALVQTEFDEWHGENLDASQREQRQVYEELTAKHKSAVVLSGSKYTSLAEFYGHQSLAIGEIPHSAYDRFTKETEVKYQEWAEDNKDFLAGLDPVEREGEKQRAHDRIFQTNLKKFESGTVSKFNLGPVYKAMEEGRPLIIDEVNAIPHAVLIGMNHVLTRKVGEPFFIPEENRTITIKEGFGVIMTGNLNHGQEKYVHREPLDPAFLNRLHKIEQDYLPQATEGALEEAYTVDNELFRVMLAKVMDSHGNAEIPEGSLDKLWRLSQAARITQDCFSGKTMGQVRDSKGQDKIPYELQESVMSMRSVNAVLDAWVNSEFEKELDFYIWDKYIKQATNPADRAYLYQTFKDQAFFDGWPDMNLDDLNNVRNFDITAPENPDTGVDIYTPRELIDILYGPAPERRQWPIHYVDVDEEAETQRQKAELNEERLRAEAQLKELVNNPNIPEDIRSKLGA